MIAKNDKRRRRRRDYVERIRKMVEAGKVKQGTVSIANIFHDDWCTIWHTGKCCCRPRIKIEQVTQ